MKFARLLEKIWFRQVYGILVSLVVGKVVRRLVACFRS